MRTILPIALACDVVVAGGTAGAVAAALAAHRAGARVVLVAPRPYLGEDIAGALRFTVAGTPEGDLARAVFPDGRCPTPLHAKTILEQALVAAGIPFLLTVQPAGLCRDAQGRIAGVVVANRNGLQVVQAAAVVDASERGLLADAARAPRAPWTTGLRIRRALAGPVAPTAAGATVTRCGTVSAPGIDGAVVEVPVWEAVWTAECAAPTAPALAALDQASALACWDARLVAASERLEADWPDRFTGLGADGRVRDDALWIAGPCADPAWRLPLTALARGEALGRAVAAAAARAGAPAMGAIAPVTVAWPAPAGGVAGARVPVEGLRAGAERLGGVDVDLRDLPALDAVDVIVCGGGTGGAPAGIAAARAGARTAVIELMSGLGGVGTLGQICRYWHGNRVGFTAEIDRGWPEMGRAVAPEIVERCRQDSGTWHPEWRARWYLDELARAGGCAWFGFATAGALVGDAQVRGAVVAGPWGVGTVGAGCCVDASGSADLAAAAGADCVTIGAEHIAVQGTGLAAKNPGRPYHNSDHTFVDDNDVADTTRALVATKLKFAGAFDVGQLIDSRERRRIVGDVEIQPADILRDRRWHDVVVVATSNFDSHGFTVHPVFLALAMHKKPLWCDIPLRALLPRALEGVLVTGLGVSAHRDALPVIRMQPDVQNQGFAAGAAAAMAATTTGGRVRAIDVGALQRRLVDAAILPERALIAQDGGEPDAREVEWAVAHGLDLHLGLAICFARPDLAAPRLRERLTGATGDARRRCALVLGLLGDATAATVLAETVAATPWDQGWNYRGMHQFGMSASPLDALVVALGSCGGAEAVAVLAAKAGELRAEADFSHCRAVAEALRLLARRGHDARAAAPALAAALAQPGMAGHAQRTLADAQAQTNADPNDNTARNRSLRELTLGVALLRCGDRDGIGRRTVEAYAADLRGHYRRHALAVLAEVAPPRAAAAR